MRIPRGQYHLGKADPGCAEEKAGMGLQPAIHSLWKCQRLSRQRGEDRNRVPATGPSPRQGGASAGPVQPAQPFVPLQAEGRGPAPAPSPAGSGSGTSSCQGHRQEEAGGGGCWGRASRLNSQLRRASRSQGPKEAVRRIRRREEVLCLQ